MERQKGTGKIDGFSREPGRRYKTMRVVPRGTEPAPVLPAERPAPPKPDVSPPKKKLRTTSTAKPAMVRTDKSRVLRRQIVEHAEQQKKKTRKRYGKHILTYGIIGSTVLAAALIIWAFQGILPFKFHIFYSEPEKTTTNHPIIQETSSLDETAITAQDIEQHKMGLDEPRVLRIPALGIEARTQRVGVSLSGEPIATGNIYDVGWFEASGKPGSEGAVLLNGHVSGPSKDGIFSGLRTLKIGDKILLERGDKQELTYVVQKIQEYSANAVDMGAAIQSLGPNRQGLNLMTTANKFTGRTDQPDKRLIVFGVLE